MRKVMCCAVAVPLALSCTGAGPEVPDVCEVTPVLSRTVIPSGYSAAGGARTPDTTCSFFFFDEDGALVSSATGCADTATFLLRSGPKTVWSFRNVPATRFSGMCSLQDAACLSVLFKDNRRGDSLSLQMAGSRAAEVVGTGPCAVDVPVERYVFRLRLGSISCSFDYPLDGADVYYVGMFLENLPSEVHLDGSPCADCALIAEGGRCGSGYILSDGSTAEDCEEPLLTLLDCRDNPVYLPSCESVDIQSGYLYSFPEGASGNLRAVVALEFDSRVFYYPVSLSGIRANESVTLHLRVTKPGSEDPDEPVLGAQAASLEPDDFYEGPSLDIVY